jgi:hypothetical protein
MFDSKPEAFLLEIKESFVKWQRFGVDQCLSRNVLQSRTRVSLDVVELYLSQLLLKLFLCLDDKRFDGIDLDGLISSVTLIVDFPKVVLELFNNLFVRTPRDDPTLVIATPDSLSNLANDVF